MCCQPGAGFGAGTGGSVGCGNADTFPAGPAADSFPAGACTVGGGIVAVTCGVTCGAAVVIGSTTGGRVVIKGA